MTEEMNSEIKEEKKCKCICQSEGFRDFLKIALGSFVGVFCAVSLFTAIHKPPMIQPCPFAMMPPTIFQGHHFEKCHRSDCHRFKMEKRNFEKQIPIKVEVED